MISFPAFLITLRRMSSTGVKFQLTATVKRDDTNALVFYKQDGQRFDCDRTIKMKVQTPYKFTLTFQPPQKIKHWFAENSSRLQGKIFVLCVGGFGYFISCVCLPKSRFGGTRGIISSRLRICIIEGRRAGNSRRRIYGPAFTLQSKMVKYECSSHKEESQVEFHTYNGSTKYGCFAATLSIQVLSS